MNRRIVFGTVCFFALFVALLGQVGRKLLFGWLRFAGETFPQARANAGGVVSGVLVFVLLIAAVHGFARTFRRTPSELPSSDSQSTTKGWRFRWSLTVVAAVVVMFAAGFATVGLARHVGWLLSSPSPWYASYTHTWHNDSQGQLWELATGVSSYRDTYGPHLLQAARDSDERPTHSWATRILPFLNYVSDDIRQDLPWTAAENRKAFQCLLPPVLNPELADGPLRNADGYGLAHYAANSLLVSQATDPAEEREDGDGTSHTILIGEVNQSFSPWADPGNVRDPALGINSAPTGFGGPSGTGGALFLMRDGSYRFLREDTDPAVLRSLSTPGSP